MRGPRERIRERDEARIGARPMTPPRDFRIGCGAGFSSDRLGPAVDLARRGHLDVLVFECVGERTLAFGHRDMRANPSGGCNLLIETRMRAILPLTYAAGTRVVTNMGVANPMAAAERTVAVARGHGDDDVDGPQSHAPAHAPGADTPLSASCCAAAFSPSRPDRARSPLRR